MVWARAKEANLRREVHRRLNQDDDVAFIDAEEFESIARADGINDTAINCVIEISDMHSSRGDYFASIRDIEIQLVHLNHADWNRFYPTICRSNAPNFERNQRPRDWRNPREFVASRQGAIDSQTSIGNTQSTVNDDLLPVDIFGRSDPNPPQNGRATEGTDKAHLLPKERGEALTWNYPAVAILGLEMANVRHESTSKAILGSYKRQQQGENETLVRFPGIRNLLCNIVRMTNQQSLFDQNSRVFIFPALDLDGMRDWQGTGYDAIVLCEDGWIAGQIGMTRVSLSDAKKATLQNLVDAMSTASLVCKFLAHSILQKSEAEVNQYQKSLAERQAHASFRKHRQVPELRGLLSNNFKPICKVSFEAHGSVNQRFHPAPDPMLLSFKSCDNVLRKFLGFRTIAGTEPLDLDDDISEEGLQNLQAYLEFQNQEETSFRHEEIMNMQFSLSGRTINLCH